MVCAVPPLLRISCATFSISADERAASNTETPSAASRRADAAPIPLLAPVMMAVFPLSELVMMSGLSFRFGGGGRHHGQTRGALAGQRDECGRSGSSIWNIDTREYVRTRIPYRALLFQSVSYHLCVSAPRQNLLLQGPAARRPLCLKANSMRTSLSWLAGCFTVSGTEKFNPPGPVVLSIPNTLDDALAVHDCAFQQEPVYARRCHHAVVISGKLFVYKDKFRNEPDSRPLMMRTN